MISLFLSNVYLLMRIPSSIVSALAFAVGIGSPAHAERAKAKAWVEEGARLQASGKADAALELYERAIAEDADYTVAYEAAAPLWFARGQDSTVIQHFERLTLRHADYAGGWHTLAFAYGRLGRFEAAILAYETYMELRPGDAEPYFGLALVYKKAGRPADALAAFSRYIELERRPARAADVEQAKSEVAALKQQLAVTEPAKPPEPEPSGTVRKELFAKQPAAPQPAPDPSPQAADGQGSAPLRARVLALMAERRYASAEAVAMAIRPGDRNEALALVLLRVEILLAQEHHARARTLLWDALLAAPAHPAVHRALAALSAPR